MTKAECETTLEIREQSPPKHPKETNQTSGSNTQIYLVSSGHKQANMAAPRHEKAPEEIDNRFTNRSINSVARIIVAESVDKAKTDDGIHQFHETKGKNTYKVLI